MPPDRPQIGPKRPWAANGWTVSCPPGLTQIAPRSLTLRPLAHPLIPYRPSSPTDPGSSHRSPLDRTQIDPDRSPPQIAPPPPQSHPHHIGHGLVP